MKNSVLALRIVLLATLLLGTCGAASAPEIDWGDCQDELDQMHTDASDASEAADDVKSKLEELEDCRRDPDTFDLMQDGCRSLRSDYESAVDDFQSKMDDVDSRVHSVQSSCNYEFTVNRLSASDAAQRRLCASYKKFLTLGLTPTDVIQRCKQHMTEEWCRSCLAR